MPYTGANDPKLPANVQGLPLQKRRQFVRVFNSAYENCRNPKIGGQGSVKKCEGVAFRFAYGAIGKKGWIMEDGSNAAPVRVEDKPPTPSDAPQEGDKQVPCEGSMVEVAFKPLGGATTFQGRDAYYEAQEQEAHIRDQEWDFHKIFANIMADEEMSLEQKAVAVGKASQELAARVKRGPEGQKGVLERVRDFVAPPRAEGKAMVQTHRLPTHEGTPWDGAAAVRELRRWASSDGSGDKEKVSWPKYRKGFATYDPDNADSFGGYHYPHHRIVGGKFVVDRAGVRAAFQRASQQKDAAAKAHMQTHREQFGFGERAVDRLTGVFSAFKDLEGAWRWMTVTTNNFRDREGEIFSEKAHQQYVRYADETGDLPELWLWHTPGSRIGEADFVAYSDGFVVHSGVFDEGMEDVAEALSRDKAVGVSHGYEYEEEDRGDGVYEWYHTFEVSVLPADKAANVYTAFAVESKEGKIMFTDEKRAFLAGKLGADRTARLEESLAQSAAELKEAGVEFKELFEEQPGGEAEATPKPEPDAAAPVAAPEATSKAKPDETPKPPEALTAEGVKAIIEEAVKSPMEEIKGSLEGLTKRIEGLERSDEEKLSALMSPNRPAPGNGGQRPSESEGTVVADQAKARKDAAALGGASDEEGDPVAGFAAQLTGGRVVQDGGGMQPAQVDNPEG